jgi:hypothetical protein
MLKGVKIRLTRGQAFVLVIAASLYAGMFPAAGLAYNLFLRH